MLSELLGVHMEEFLVKRNVVPLTSDIEWHYPQNGQGRLVQYYNKIKWAVA
jgi:hypothetical protein